MMKENRLILDNEKEERKRHRKEKVSQVGSVTFLARTGQSGKMTLLNC